jgi:hypothetical protein
MSSDTFYSNLGPPGDVYDCCSGWTVSGTGTVGTSFTAANLFTSLISGSISEIDVGVGYVTGTNSFYVALFTNNGNLPGTQLGRWDNLSSSQSFGGCCGLVTITGISGVTLTAGEDFWLVMGPEHLTDTTWEAWNWNNQGDTVLDLYSTDGGGTWNSNGLQPAGAGAIIGTSTVPEPSSLLLFGSGLIGAVGVLRRKINL